MTKPKKKKPPGKTQGFIRGVRFGQIMSVIAPASIADIAAATGWGTERIHLYKRRYPGLFVPQGAATNSRGRAVSMWGMADLLYHDLEVKPRETRKPQPRKQRDPDRSRTARARHPA